MRNVMVERELTAIVNGISKQVIVRIGKPVPVAYRGDPLNHYECPYQITGLGRDAVHYICGLDSMQALVLCLQFIGTELERQKREMKLTWVGERNLGFPKLRIAPAPKGRNERARHGSAG